MEILDFLAKSSYLPTDTEVCTDDTMKLVLSILKLVLNIIRILVPIALIVLGSIDMGLNSLVTSIAKSGALYERAQLNAVRSSKVALDTTQMISREGDLDFTKAITDMKMLDYTNQATLSNAGKMFNSTLLNYMR